jgi:hypothetical protein
VYFRGSFAGQLGLLLWIFRLRFAALRETESIENKFRAKAQMRIGRRKGKSGAIFLTQPCSLLRHPLRLAHDVFVAHRYAPR